MFTKYVGKFGKAEIEWCLELLDMTVSDEDRARELIADTLEGVLDKNRELVDGLPRWWEFWKKTPKLELTALEEDIQAMTLATEPAWWTYLEEAKEIWIQINLAPTPEQVDAFMERTKDLRAEMARKYKEEKH